MKKILFVDDEQPVLDGLRRLLHELKNEWDMEFVNSGREALAKLSENTFDLIVCDMRMPEMDGAELLDLVREKYPKMVRIILTGYSELDILMRSIGPAHQFLTKPIELDELKNVIDRSLRIHSVLNSEKVQAVISRMRSLPSLPEFYLKLMDLLTDPESSIKEVADLVKKDMAMTVQVLKLVNSSYFGFYKRINDPAEATVMLGLNTIKSLALSHGIFSQMPDELDKIIPHQELWDHSSLTSLLAQDIAKHISYDDNFVDDAFTAGFLHEIGLLILAGTLPDTYMKAVELAEKDQIPLWLAEHHIMETGHAEIGAYILALWGFDDNIVQAILNQHQPFHLSNDSNSLAAVIHAADTVSRSLSYTHDALKFTMPDERFRAQGEYNAVYERWLKISEKRLSKAD